MSAEDGPLVFTALVHALASSNINSIENIAIGLFIITFLEIKLFMRQILWCSMDEPLLHHKICTSSYRG